jgi:hypothetical protein
MANFYRYDFTATDNYTGELAAGYLEANTSTPFGGICQPGDSRKIAPGTNFGGNGDWLIWNLDHELRIVAPGQFEWDSISESGESYRHKWFKQFLVSVGLEEVINDIVLYTELFDDFNNTGNFEIISGPCVAYVEQDSNTFEVKIGVNSYDNRFFIDWLDANQTNPKYNFVSDRLNPSPHYTTHVMLVEYSADSHLLYSFDGTVYSGYTGPGATISNLENGGGNIYTEFRLAGIEYEADYDIKENVDVNDPTGGLCSGNIVEILCIGEKYWVIDKSTLSKRNFTGTNNDFTWTWVNSHDAIDRKWFIADVSQPCTDYANIPISEMLFPLRVISECTFEDFN